MSEFTIYHNPRCTKSRATLALLEGRGIAPRVVEYLKTPPTAPELAEIIAKLGIEAEVDRILAHERTLEEAPREDVHTIGLERLQEAHADLRRLGDVAKLDATQLALAAQSFTEGRQPASGRNVVSTGSFRAIWPRNSGF